MTSESPSIDRRLLKLLELRDRPGASEKQKRALQRARQIELEICALDKVYWFNTWAWTYNPKLVGAKDPRTGEKLNPWMPFDLFPRQEELVRWLEDRSRLKEDGHVGKSRDIGFTWVCGGYALHRWLFEDGYKANFGSRKGEYVDRIGDADSIFEKIRLLYRGLPPWMLPRRMSDNSMLLLNDDRSSAIRGEAGDDMGRGGRSTDYFFDEFAFVERADGVDAASIANSDCRIFGSTVNGMGNLFYRMQADGRLREDQKFRFHWSDDPRKRDGMVLNDVGQLVSWEKHTKKKMEKWKFASEYDIDYAASVEGICIPGSWVEACKKLGTLVKYEPPRRGKVGGDVGAGGKGKSVAVARFGALVVTPKSWGHGDTIKTAQDMLDYANSIKFVRQSDKYACTVTEINYDVVGVGKGTQDAFKRKQTTIATTGINTGTEPSDEMWPDGKSAKDIFLNLKAELWWKIRERAKKSYEKVLFLEGHEADADDERQPVDHPIDECLILPGDRHGPDATLLAQQLSTVKVELDHENGKIRMQSKKSMAKAGMPSPDHADALVLTEARGSNVDVWLKAFGVQGAQR